MTFDKEFTKHGRALKAMVIELAPWDAPLLPELAGHRPDSSRSCSC